LTYHLFDTDNCIFQLNA